MTVNTDATPPHGDYYVTVRDGKRTGFLLGPYSDVRDALANVARGARLAREANRDAHWHTFGTARVAIGTPIRPVFTQLLELGDDDPIA